jgi:hypothetical protein
LEEGQTQQALKISLSLRRCSTEFNIIQDDIACFLEDLQVELSEGDKETTLKQGEGELPTDQARANVLELALEYEHE